MLPLEVPAATGAALRAAPRPPARAARSGELHLLAEAPAGSRAPLRALVAAPGVSYLVPGGAPALTRRRPRRAALALEPVRTPDGARRLLVLVPEGLELRWNALPAPPVLLLRVRDQLRAGDGPVLHLSEHRSARAGAPSPELVGRPCGVCRLALTAATTVLCCRRCGVPMHLEGPPVPAEQRLECATFAGACPACEAPCEAPGEGGYVWLPELGGLPRG